MKASISIFVVASVVILGVDSVMAQGGPKAAAAASIELTPEELADRIPLVEAQIGDREERALELTNDIIELDDRIEGRIDRVLKLLKGMKDSNDSGTRVVRMKQEAMDGLSATIDYYDSKRRDLKMEAYERDPKIEREDLFKSIATYDGRIEKRISQILDLAQTFMQHKDLPKYTYARSGGRWGGRTRHRNPAYQQNRSQTIQTGQTQRDLIEALQQTATDMDRRNRDIQERMKKPMTDQYRALLQEELDGNEQLMAQREEQIGMLLEGPSGGGKAVSTRSAMTTEGMIDDLVADIQDDFDDLFADIYELNQEKMNLKYLRERLEVGKKALGEE
jgi:hypothetical protein